jgi:DNA-binding transcriptional MerR regulator
MTRTWRIGELARAAGVTVRTLHHYDAVGLLAPSARTDAGYRLYGPADVERLYRIRALAGLGLSLDEVARVLDGLPLDAVLERQLEAVDAGLASLGALRERLVQLRRASSVDELFETMEAMEMFEKHFSEEQRAAIASRADLAEQGERDWAALIAEAQSHREARTPPTDPAMLDVARRWRGLIEQFTGGDEGIRGGLVELFREHGPERATRGAVDAELMAYVGEAMRHV